MMRELHCGLTSEVACWAHAVLVFTLVAFKRRSSAECAWQFGHPRFLICFREFRDVNVREELRFHPHGGHIQECVEYCPRAVPAAA